MPKAKPTQVIVHRIELQEKERDMLEAVVAGQTVKNVVVPVAVVGGVGSAAYISYKALKSAYDWGTDIIDEIKDIPADIKTADDVFKAREKAGYTPPGAIGIFYKIRKWTFG